MYNKSYAIWHFANRLSVLTDSEIKRTWLFFRQHLSHLEEVNLSTTSIFKGYAKYKVSDLITKMMPSGGTMSRWVHYIKSTYRVNKSKRIFEKTYFQAYIYIFISFLTSGKITFLYLETIYTFIYLSNAWARLTHFKTS